LDVERWTLDVLPRLKIPDLPAINATLNLISTIFISCGWYLIRRGHWRRHTGLTAWIYFPMLISHVLLAFVTLPLVIVTLVPVFRRRWDKHTRIARWTMPIWLYVSVTGVLVYLMLYKWFPSPNLALGQ
jgi:putative membrane protein